MKNLVKAILLIFLISPLSAAELSTAENLFIKALEGEETFFSAASEFASMINGDMADPGTLYYNLGNALYFDGDKTGALCSYSAALYYKPGNSDYLANRNLVLSEMDLSVPVLTGTEYVFFAPLMILGVFGSRLFLGIILFTALICALVYLVFRKEFFRTGSIILLMLAFILSFSVFSWDAGRSERGVVKKENTVLRQGDNPLYEKLGDLLPGTELMILEEREGWYRIRTKKTEDQDSTRGWLNSKDVMRVSELIESLN